MSSPVSSRLPANAVLRSRTFRRLASAYWINELGNWIADVALAILVFDRSRSALGTAALFISLRFLPAAIGPLLTARIVVADARRVLTAIHLIEGLIFAAIAWLAGHYSLPALLALAAADGVLAVAAKALTRGATASLLLPTGELRQGNAILNIGFTVGAALGPALAGLLVALVGVAGALLVEAGTFLVVAGIFATTRELRFEADGSTRPLARLRSGAREAWSSDTARRLLIAQSLALVFFTSVVPIEVLYAKQTLHVGDAGYGALLATWGAGMIVGSVAYATIRVPLLAVLALSTTIIAVSYAGLAEASALPVACAFSALGGIGNGAQWVAALTAIQQAVSTTAQTPVMAMLEALNQLMPALGFLFGGAVATLGSPRIAYAAAAAGVLLVLLAAARHTPRLGVVASTRQAASLSPSPSTPPVAD